MSERTIATSITVDEKECAFYTKACPEWWDQDGVLKPLHSLNTLYFQYIRDSIAKPEGLKVLDAGCGGGISSETMAKWGYNVTGIDVNLDVIKVARQHAAVNGLNINYLFESVEQHALENEEKYDVISLGYVLQHVKNHQVILSSCVRMLKPGGCIYISAVGKTVKAWLDFKIWEHVVKVMPIGANHWSNFIKCSTVEDFLTSNGCSIKCRKGFYYSVLKSQWFWGDDVDTIYLIHAVKK